MSGSDEIESSVAENQLSNAQCASSSSSVIPHPSSLRILLWDIDGTLLHSPRRGAFKDYTIPMLKEVFGTAGRLPQMVVAGMTDLQIVAEALKDEGFTNEDILERVDQLRESYMGAMHKSVANDEQFFELLPGAREVLQAVSQHPRYHSALLTGNIEAAAHFKMKLVGLSEFFDLPGAFGDESHDRRDLPAFAADRIRKQLEIELTPEQFIVIGDTPNDIECARHFGARAVAVATGRLYGREDLLACKPDALLPDLSQVELVMRMLAAL